MIHRSANCGPRWRAITSNIDTWQASLPDAQRKPIIFTEIGYMSRDGHEQGAV